MPTANPMKAEAALGEHMLAVTFNGWCSLEGETGNKVPQLLQGLQEGIGFAELRTWVRVFVTTPMTEEQAGELIGEVGLEPSLKALDKAVNGFFANQPKDKKDRPLKAA